ncbi:hypothetical protein CLV28_1097 [Sediminihabitans luteus]|uniref:Histidine kinase/HSP90-like ATPase domain-containing protein n=1 Tax=Sediminihabitans luteus TaxID=1138585 RepID=A0A2M9D0Y9_9CELL|nr:ATP-binding protein [Sediminihabitans luteus]PJJ77871.1 hypothetical protein CLV28_1097 [Sediminihabitans luteus]GII99771.1 hypothetical protein Slu03_21490 [Sediminihabitans luteus]
MHELDEQVPPAGFVPQRRWVIDSLDELARLRGTLHEELTGLPPAAGARLTESAEQMVLVASELATNALRHALPPTRVVLSTRGTQHLLDVADHDPTGVPEFGGDRAPGEGGFGLILVARVAEAVGWYRVGNSKHVWAVFTPEPGAPDTPAAEALAPTAG